ncbi:MAG: hypothetical protein IGS48_14750 [Oscillatoriales cyanobacterium C42_A2020_001]|nr:hypothetical protein [Leptolyngbyaceae cyanobacterium C42_A2020_001]
MNPPTEFLTPEECAEVDKALLTSHDKFTTRVAIYALRSLKQVALQEGVAIAALQPEQIENWVYQDSSLQAGLDRQFRQFFSRLVISSTKPLIAAARELNVEVEQLTVPQVIAWFEKEGKAKLAQQ